MKPFNEFLQIDEAAQDTLGSHKVIVTVSEPDHPAVSKRKERVMKRVVVKALGRDDAKAKAEAFYKKKGYKVHDTEYHSKVPNATMKTEELEESKAYDQGSWAALKGKSYSENPHPKGSPEHLDWSKGHNATRADKAQNEEVEQIDELSKATLGSYIKKASEQGKKAAVSKNQSSQGLSTAIASGNEHLAGVHDDNIKYSNKLEKKRAAGVSKAVDKLTKEDVEQIDELSKDTLASYTSKSFQHANDLHYDLAHMRGNKATDAERKAVRDKITKRNQGVITAVKKMKEETSMISYSEFMEKLEESRASERAAEILAAKRAERLDNYDYSKEKEKHSGPAKQVKGRSYGAGEDGDEDEDEKKQSSEPAVKRGRGRPAGSKSGARV